MPLFNRLLLSHLSLLKPKIHPKPIRFLIRGLNSWSLAIRNASSPHKALQLYSQRHRQSLPFDTFSILFTLKSCTHLRNLSLIRHFHSHLLKLGFHTHVYVATCLLNAYVVASFDDALSLFDEMPHRNTVTWNTMVSGYSKLGDVEKARNLFDRMALRDVASWSAMIACYMGNGLWLDGFVLFREMLLLEELKPDQATLCSILPRFAHMGSVGFLLGRSVHGFIVKNGLEITAALGTVLVDLYAKCGYLKNASRVFSLMQVRDVVSWTALICGSAQRGYGKEALSIFDMMRQAGVRPNELTFTGVLTACAQTGMVEEGREYFRMIEGYGLKPTIQHFGCMVDMFGKAGLLGEAYEVIRTMTLKPNIVVWGSFLCSCKLHKQFEMAERVFDQVMELAKLENDGGVYTLISDLYVLSGKWDDAERVRELMVNQNVKKTRGSSFVRCEAGF